MLEMSDVVVAIGADGGERVLLRGADLRVRNGETVLVVGLDAEARRSMTSLLTGRIQPRYGTVGVGRVRSGRLGDPIAGGDTVVLDAGDAPGAGSAAQPLPVRADGAVLVLGGDGWRPSSARGSHRSLTLAGGQLVDVTPAQPARAPAEPARMPVDEVRRRTEQALLTAGASAGTAATVSAVLVDADRRGHSSHGVALLPTYLRRVRDGGIIVGAQPRMTLLTPTLASVDAGGGFGQPAAALAAQWCAETAAEQGLAAAAVHTNNHVGMLAAYRWPFQQHRVAGLVLNISAPSVAAPGAVRPTLGSNAVCLITPTGADEPFCVDLATGVVAAGKIRDAGHRGASLPPGWLLDKDGAPSTDPAQLDQGGSIPLFGGYKGLCITLIAEILAGALAGGRVSPDVARQVTRTEQVMSCSQLFIGLSVRHFTDSSRRADLPGPADMDSLVERLRGAVRAGYDAAPSRPWFPDQMETDHAEQATQAGLAIPATVLAALGWDRQ